MAKHTLFEMGAKWDEGWTADNRAETPEAKTLSLPPQRHRLDIVTEKRRGKTVTVVSEFYLEASALTKLLKTLKQALATGGTQKNNALEFQGDVKERLRVLLIKHGFDCA